MAAEGKEEGPDRSHLGYQDRRLNPREAGGAVAAEGKEEVRTAAGTLGSSPSTVFGTIPSKMLCSSSGLNSWA